MIVRIQFTNGKSGEYEIFDKRKDLGAVYDSIDMAYKDHTSIYAYKAFYDAATDKYDIRESCLPFIINTAHIVLIEVIEE
jgi:hypothetical protein